MSIFTERCNTYKEKNSCIIDPFLEIYTKSNIFSGNILNRENCKKIPNVQVFTLGEEWYNGKKIDTLHCINELCLGAYRTPLHERELYNLEDSNNIYLV